MCTYLFRFNFTLNATSNAQHGTHLRYVHPHSWSTLNYLRIDFRLSLKYTKFTRKVNKIFKSFKNHENKQNSLKYQYWYLNSMAGGRVIKGKHYVLSDKFALSTIFIYFYLLKTIIKSYSDCLTNNCSQCSNTRIQLVNTHVSVTYVYTDWLYRWIPLSPTWYSIKACRNRNARVQTLFALI